MPSGSPGPLQARDGRPGPAPPVPARTCPGAEADPADEAAAGQRGAAGPDPALARVHADEAAGAAGLHGHQAGASARRRGLLAAARRRALGAVTVVEAEEAAGLHELAEVGAELGGAQRGRDTAHQAVANGGGGAAITGATAGRRHLGPPGRRVTASGRAVMTLAAGAREWAPPGGGGALQAGGGAGSPGGARPGGPQALGITGPQGGRRPWRWQGVAQAPGGGYRPWGCPGG